VDDLLIAAKTIQEVQKIKNVLNRAFDIKNFGEIKNIINIRVIKNRFKGTLILN